MKIPVLFGTVTITFEFGKTWYTRKEVRRILINKGKPDKNMRIHAIKRVREITGCGLVEAVVYTDKFFPKEERIYK